MKRDDSLAADALQWAFSGKKAMPPNQREQVGAVIRQSRLANKESEGKRRSRYWGLGPVWARRFG